MRREAGLALVLVGLGAMAALWWSSRSGDWVRSGAGLEDRAGPVASQDQADVAGLSNSIRPSPQRDPQGNIGAADVAVGSRTAANGLQFQVVDGSTRQPVPDAEVFCLAASSLDPRQKRELEEWGEGWDQVVALGNGVALDDQAQATLDPSLQRVAVLARQGDRLAWDSWDASLGGSHVLELMRRPVLHVRTVNVEGASVPGVTVLWLRYQSSMFFSSLPQALTLERKVTEGGRAVATFRHLPTSPDEGLDHGMYDEQGWFASLELPGMRIQEARTLDLSLPEQEVTLVVPPTGSLEVEIRDGDELLTGVPIRVQVESVDQDYFLQDQGQEMVLPPDLARFTLGGRVFWSHVGTETDLTVTASIPDHPLVSMTEPRLREGERRRLVLTPSDPLPRVLGRAVDEEGRPLAEVDLVWGKTRKTDKGPASWGDGRITTDEEGRFAIAMPPDRNRLLWLGQPVSAGRNFAACRSHGSVELPDLPETGERDVGDVILSVLPLYHKGLVQDEQGRPIAGAVIHALNLKTSAWISGETRTDQDGRFELRGNHREVWDGGLRVQAEGFAARTEEGYSKALERVLIPEGESTFTLVRHRVLRGAWALPDNLPASDVTPQLPSDAYTFQGKARSWRLEGPPGPCVLRLAVYESSGLRSEQREPGDDGTLTLLEQELVLPPAEVAGSSADTGPFLDLRGSLWCHRVEVQDARGMALSGSWVRLDPETVLWADRFGRVLLSRAQPLATLLVGGPHHRTRTVETEPGLSSATVATLSPGLPIRVEVTGAEASRVMLIDGAGGWVDLVPLGGSVFEGGAPGPGTYQINVWPTPGLGTDPWEASITVGDSAQLQVLPVRLGDGVP